PGAALDHVDRELVVVRPGDHPLARGLDHPGALGVQNTEVPVGASSGLLDHRVATDELWVLGDRRARDGEVLHRPGRVHTPVRFLRDLDRADRVDLAPHDHDHLHMMVLEYRCLDLRLPGFHFTNRWRLIIRTVRTLPAPQSHYAPGTDDRSLSTVRGGVRSGHREPPVGA